MRAWREAQGSTAAHRASRATYERVLLDIVNERVHLHLLDEGAELVEVDEELADPHLIIQTM